jgi:tetratricopeptide (TPR) repeat protein
MRNVTFVPAWTGFLVVLLAADCALAQSFHRGGTEFNAARLVTVPAGKPYTIVVTEFFHHGEIRPDGRNVVVVAQNKELAPMRVLQVGPGDFCRLAFQTLAGQSSYEILYGGDPATEKTPPWSCRDGLLLETRQFKPFNLNSLEALRETFDKAVPIGADYVDGVFHSHNPFVLADEPFVSHYSGYMDIRKPGDYGLVVSSQDCSFLLVDDKLVASAPGYHGPEHQVLPGRRHDLKLGGGLHKFDYYHAAAGASSMMVAVWEIDPADGKSQRPTPIPGEVFHSYLVARLPASHLSLRTAKHVPDFVAKIAGDVPLPDNDVPLVGVLFRDNSIRALTMSGAKLQWDFGDGQTSDLPNVDHVYLRPGLYAVKLSVRRAGKTIETTNRIEVDRPHLNPKDKNQQYSLNDYLRIIETYDPKTLDAPSLCQMVRALEAKAAALANRAEDAAQKAQTREDDPNRRHDNVTRASAGNVARPPSAGNVARPPSAVKSRASQPGAAVLQAPAESERYLAKAVAAGRVAFEEGSIAKGDEDLLKLAQLIGPMARDLLGDSEAAFQIWQGAAQRITAAEGKAACETAAADIAINDLLKAADAKPLLESAAKQLGDNKNGPLAIQLERVWGDYYAATGDGKSANKAYAEAERLVEAARPFSEMAARRGAHARSAEEFVKEKQFGRAAAEIQAWQEEFPMEKMDGYLALLSARNWAGRGKFTQAIAQSEQLLAVSPDSPYIDQLLLVAADSEMRRGRKDRALATLHALLKDYPGSPLAPLAKKNIEVLEGAGQAK